MVFIGATFANASTLTVEKSLDELYRDAKAGVSDLTQEEMQSFNVGSSVTLTPDKRSTLMNSTLEETPRVETFSTAQVLKDDEDSKVVAVTTFSDISFLSNSDDSIRALGGQADNDSNDPTNTVRAYSTIYWETTKIEGYDFIRLTRTTGGWQIFDTGFTVTNRSVTYGGTGIVQFGTKPTTPEKTVTVNMTFDLSSTFDWLSKADPYSVGMKSKATVNRGSSSWTVNLNNQNP